MRPPLDAYDVLIHLDPKQVPLLSQAVDRPLVTFSRGVSAGVGSHSGGALPVIEYNPVSLYLSELRVSRLVYSWYSRSIVNHQKTQNKAHLSYLATEFVYLV